MHKTSKLSLVRQNLRLVKKVYPDLTKRELWTLRDLTRALGLRLSSGEIRNIDGGWYVTHSGLLQIAQRRRCIGIRSHAQREFCDPGSSRWVFKATVFTRPCSKGFVGYGDAEPSNVSPLVRGAEMRVAETRAVNRALRKAYGIGLCSVEELSWISGTSKSPLPSSQPNGSHSANSSSNSQPRLRDRLCLLIRQYNLDPTLVKAYAADFCGTAELRQASRDLVESFVSQLAAAAKEDRDALVCKLNSYSRSAEVKS
jgi:hypothetical protein